MVGKELKQIPSTSTVKVSLIRACREIGRVIADMVNLVPSLLSLGKKKHQIADPIDQRKAFGSIGDICF